MEQLQHLNKTKLGSVLILLKNDIVFSFSLILALASCFWVQPQVNSINFKVLACLFNLMIVVKAFEELQLLEKFAVDILNKCTSTRKVSLILIALTFFTSMLITNDVSLITLVPLTLVINRKSGKDMLITVILQTLAANIGSSLTPMGNPQNLFIFSYYKLTAVQFMLPIILFSAAGFIWLYVLNLRTHNFYIDVSFEKVSVKDKKTAFAWAVLFIIIVLSVFDMLDYRLIFLLVLISALIINPKLIRKVDYPLLVTFVCFFIFIGNISSIPAIRSYMETALKGGGSTYFGSIVLSQFISNVPCSVFLSKFTGHWKELLLGVNIGGMGTIISSLASVISYKLYTKENPEKSKKYLLMFSLYNFASLVLFTLINYPVILIK